MTKCDQLAAPSERPAQLSVPRTFAAFMLAALGAGLSLNVGPILVTAVANDFAISVDYAGWMVTATLLATAAWLPIAGGLTRRFRGQTIITTSVLLSAAGAALTVLAPNFELVIVGRGLMGLSLVCVSISIAFMRGTMAAPLAFRGAALVSTSFAAGSAVAVPLAGVIEDYLGWRYVGGFLAVIFVVAAIIAPRSDRSGSDVQKITSKWIAISAIWVISIAAFLVTLSAITALSWINILVFVVSLIAVAKIVLSRQEADHALLDPRASRGRGIVMVNVVSAVVGFGTFMFTVFAAVKVVASAPEGGLGLSFTYGAIVATAMPISMVIGTQVSALILRKYSERALILIGLASVAIGSVWLALSGDRILDLVVVGAMVGFGAGLCFVGMPLAAIAAVPADVSGQSATLNGLSQVLGSSTASVVVGTLLVLGIETAQGVIAIIMLVSAVIAASGIALWRIPHR